MEEAATACRHQWSETRRDKPPLGAVPVSQPLIKSHVISLLICPACSLAAEAIGGGGAEDLFSVPRPGLQDAPIISVCESVCWSTQYGGQEEIHSHSCAVYSLDVRVNIL